jgi:hypothetical protein
LVNEFSANYFKVGAFFFSFFLVLLKQDGMRIFIKEKSMIKNAGVKTDFVCFLNVLNLMEEFFV